MSVDEARHTSSDVVPGLEYLHHQGIISRDSKSANLLCNEHRSTVKISDTGVSHASDALLRATPGEDNGFGGDDRALRKTASQQPGLFRPQTVPPGPVHSDSDPCAGRGGRKEYTLSANTFRASHDSQWIQYTTVSYKGTLLSKMMVVRPLPPHDPSQPRSRPTVGQEIDVRAPGVTLYCLLFGNLPFMACIEYELYNIIVKEGIHVPPAMGREGAGTGYEPGWPGHRDGLEGREASDLLGRLLEKHPAKQITLFEVKHHAWRVLRNLNVSLVAWLSTTDRT